MFFKQGHLDLRNNPSWQETVVLFIFLLLPQVQPFVILLATDFDGTSQLVQQTQRQLREHFFLFFTQEHVGLTALGSQQLDTCFCLDFPMAPQLQIDSTLPLFLAESSIEASAK